MFNLEDLGKYNSQKKFKNKNWKELKNLAENNSEDIDTDTYELYHSTKKQPKFFAKIANTLFNREIKPDEMTNKRNIKKIMNKTFKLGGILSSFNKIKF
jgi:esterase/lipase